MFRIFLIGIILIASVACTPTNTPTSTTASTLTASFTASNSLGGTATIVYPEGWVFAGDLEFGYQFFNQQVLLDTRPDTFTTGQAAIGFFVVPDALAVNFGSGEGTITAESIMSVFQRTFSSGDVQFGASEALTLNGVSGVQVQGTGTNGDSMIVVIDGDGAFIITFAAAATGELSQYADTVRAMATQSRYSTQ